MLIYWCYYKHTVCLSIYSSIKIIFCSLFLCLTCEICFSNISYNLQNMMLTDFPCFRCKSFYLLIFRTASQMLYHRWFLLPSSFFFLVWWAIYWNVDEFELFRMCYIIAGLEFVVFLLTCLDNTAILILLVVQKLVLWFQTLFTVLIQYRFHYRHQRWPLQR